VGETLVWHKGSASFKRTGQSRQRYYDTRNLYLLIAKHARSHGSTRGPVRSRVEWLRYAYYRYCVEREAGAHDGAEAVLAGLWDAVVGHHGAFVPRRRPGLSVLRLTLEALRRARPRAQHGHAAPVR
jgi:hypothetical protein